MPDIFGPTALAAFQDDNKVRLTVQGLSDNEKIFLTQVRLDTAPNFQLMYSIGAERFINSFSHRLSNLVIEGIYVLADCNGPLDQNTSPPFLEFYKENNISSSEAPIRIAYTGIVLTGFLTSLTTNRHNQEAFDGYKFSMGFLGAIPGVTDAGGGGAAASGDPNSFPDQGILNRNQNGKTGPSRSAEVAVQNLLFRQQQGLTSGQLQSINDRNIRNGLGFN